MKKILFFILIQLPLLSSSQHTFSIVAIDSITKEQIEIESQYSGYLDRQKEDILDFKKEESLLLPNDLNYNKVGSLSNEIIEKLSKIQPPTLGAASRISGVTPAAIIALLRHVKKQKNNKPKQGD